MELLAQAHWWWAAYLALGLFVGVLAGLLGIGGGVVIVPLLVLMFGSQQFAPDRVMHLALGTSLASIVLTSLSSVRAHHLYKAVMWDIVCTATPAVAVGTLLGTLFADALPSRYLAIFFVAFVLFSALQMWLGRKPKPTANCRAPLA